MEVAMLSRLAVGLFVVVLVELSGCTQLGEIRVNHGAGSDVPTIDVEHPSLGCVNAASTEPSRANSIEDYGDYWASYVEVDDEGWMYPSIGKPNQLEVLDARLKKEMADPAMRDTDFLVVAFVHGWHHNANDNDCNVHEFRAMLKVANDRYGAAFKKPFDHRRRVVGVYVGWRGESINADLLKYTTVLDRSNAADRVAKGDVREIFAVLRKIQVRESLKSGRADRMRTVVIGHSFGGLIAFHGLSPAILNELTLTKPELGPGGCRPTVYRSPPAAPRQGNSDAPTLQQDLVAPVFPDLLVLINPAFEATRFETLHNLMRPSEGCAFPTYEKSERPKIIVVTADDDRWTGPVFTAGRRIMTAMEAYPRNTDASRSSNERDSNTHAIGFTERYKTHRLCIQNGVAVAAMKTPSGAEWPAEPFAPVWVVGAPPEIVKGHDGFLFAKESSKPYLLDWLVELHTFGPGEGSPAMGKPGVCDLAVSQP